MAFHFVIPKGTTSIYGDSLEEWGVDIETLEKVTIPISVESIGAQAFLRCSALVDVKIPTSVKSIGFRAFEGCSALVDVKIPISVESIGKIWTELEDTKGADQHSDESATTAAGSKRPRDDASVATQPDGDGRSPKRQLPEPAP